MLDLQHNTRHVSALDIKEICGAIHLHTTYSDGGTTFEELIDAARDLNLDFIVVTDHMSMESADAGFEGFHDKLLVVIGYEHNDSLVKNHYLAIGTDRVYGEFSQPQEYVHAVRESGGIGFLAHPAEKRNFFGNLPPYPWTAWDVAEFDGIEIWNQMSDWMEQLRSWAYFIRLMYPRRFICNAPSELLQRWDTLNRTRFVSGIGGVDAHAHRLKFLFFHYTVFPIRVELKGIRTHLYLDKNLSDLDKVDAKKALMKALCDGKGFVSNYRWGDATGSRFFLECADGSIVFPGARSTNTPLPALLHVELPASAQIRLIQNGVVIEQRSGSTASFSITKPAVYRIEVFKNDRAWIYSNPFPTGDYPL